MDYNQALDSCYADSDTLVMLPRVQLDRDVYTKLANSLKTAGGKWDRRQDGFTFNGNAIKLLSLLKSGGTPNPTKEFQFFATPTTIAKKMAKLLAMEQGDRILEPSAGKGSLVDAIHYWYPGKLVEGFELMELNREYLSKVKSFKLIGEDFMDCREYDGYDKIIANPPFSKKQDIQHILKMWGCLKPGGKIVTLASPSYTYATDKVSVGFREFVERYAVHVETLAAGSFKESGTMIETRLIVLYKPKLFTYEGQTREEQIK